MRLGQLAGTALVAVLASTWVGPVLADGPPAAALSASPGAAAPSPPGTGAPGSDAAFVAEVRAAIIAHDIDFFDKHLVDWDGARKRTQRLTLFQIRECFGRPIKSIDLEPLKPNPAEPLVPEGYKTNLPVTHLLHVTFDEKHVPEETPACVLMLSKDPNASYRMVLVLPTAPPPK